MSQLDLFPPAPLDTTADAALARHRPEGLYLGTSSWTFRGWAGLVYRGRPSQEDLVREGLREYARHPLFNTVSIDRSYYAPLTVSELRHYASQLPEGFRCVMKVWQGLCTPVDPKMRQPNPLFFDPLAFREQVLEPVLTAFAPCCGPLLFQLPPCAPADLPKPNRFAAILERFFAGLPTDLRYAVEVRNAELLSPQYFAALARANVSHVFNHWERMPSIGEQLRLPGALCGDTVVCRLLLPQGLGYEAAREAFAPFDRLQAIDPEMRRDAARLWEACRAAGKRLYLIVNNKAEGSSPLTVRALLKELGQSPE